MGNDHYNQYTFHPHDWQLLEKNPAYSLWRHKVDRTVQVQQYDLFSAGQQEYRQEREVFEMRYRHGQLVAGLYFEEQGGQGELCGSSRGHSLYVQRMPIGLSDIEHIPFPDYLHLYHQALSGFTTISRHYGCFQVQEDHIAVNQKGIVKVWMNRDYSRSVIAGGRISEEQMVQGIINTIDASCDSSKYDGIPSVRNYLFRSADQLKFSEALRQLGTYTLTYNQGKVPPKLDCIDRVGGIQVIVNRQCPDEESSDNNRSRNIYLDRKNQGQCQQQRLSSTSGPVQPQLINPVPNRAHIQQPEAPANQLPHPQHQHQYPHPPQMAAGPSLQQGLKGSHQRSEVIINPQVIRDNMAMVRRKSDYEQGAVRVQKGAKAEQPKHMKYSQTIQPSQSHNWATSPVQHTGKISFVVPPLKNKHNQQHHQQHQQHQQHNHQHGNIQVIPAVIRNAQCQGVNQPGLQARPGHPQPRLSSQLSNHQITFQRLTNNPFRQSARLNNTSIANLSAHTSESNTQRMIIRTINSPRQEVNQLRPSKLNWAQDNANNKQASPVVMSQPAQIMDATYSNRPVQQQGVQLDGKRQAAQQDNFITSQAQPVSSHGVTNRISEGTTPVDIQTKKGEPQSYQQTIHQIKEEPYHPSKQHIQQHIQASSNQHHSFQAVGADDGKSSEEFMRKLHEITSGIVLSNSPEKSFDPSPTYSLQESRPNYQLPSQHSPNVINHRHSQSLPQPQANMHMDDSDFGRPAESNIIYSPEPQGHSSKLGKTREPLKFERDIEMKYSVLQPDSPQLAKGGSNEGRLDRNDPFTLSKPS